MLRGLPLRRGLFVVEVLDVLDVFVLLAAAVPADGAIHRDPSCAVAIQHRALTPSATMRSQLASDPLGVRGGGGRASSDAQVLVAVAPRGLCLLVVRHVAPVGGDVASKLPSMMGSGQVPVKLLVSPAPALAGHRMALMRPPDGAQNPAVFVCGMQPSIRPLCARVGGGWRARASGQQQLVCVSPGQHLDSRVVSGEASAAVHGGALSAQGDSSTTKPSAVIIADRSIVERMEPSNSMLPKLLRSQAKLVVCRHTSTLAVLHTASYTAV